MVKLVFIYLGLLKVTELIDEVKWEFSVTLFNRSVENRHPDFMGKTFLVFSHLVLVLYLAILRSFYWRPDIVHGKNIEAVDGDVFQRGFNSLTDRWGHSQIKVDIFLLCLYSWKVSLGFELRTCGVHQTPLILVILKI